MADFPSSSSSSSSSSSRQSSSSMSKRDETNDTQQIINNQNKKEEESLRFPPYDFNLASARRPRDFEGFDLLEKIVNRGNFEEHPLYFWHDDKVVIIYDAYPKASVHLLMLPQDTSIKSVADFDAGKIPTSVDMLKHMKFVSDQLTNSILRQLSLSSSSSPTAGAATASSFDDNNNNNNNSQKTADISKKSSAVLQLGFRVGFHTKPSLRHCHMHIISKDFFNSPNIKHKVHYRSFATDFFFEVVDVLAKLAYDKEVDDEKERHTKIPANELARRIQVGEEAMMRCYYCARDSNGFETTSFAAMKKHFATCRGLMNFS